MPAQWPHHFFCMCELAELPLSGKRDSLSECLNSLRVFGLRPGQSFRGTVVSPCLVSSPGMFFLFLSENFSCLFLEFVVTRTFSGVLAESKETSDLFFR